MDSEGDLVAAIENNELVTHDFMTFGPFAMTDEGLTKDITYRNKVIPGVKVAAPFKVIGYCRNSDGEGWGKTIRFHDADGRLHIRHVSDVALHADPSKLAGEIGSGGLYINRTRQKEFAEYLNGVEPPDRVTHVNRTGWHEIHGKLVFVLPEETIGPDALGEAVVLEGAEAGNYESKGSLADWQAGVGTLAAGHPWMIFAISTALAGPLAYLVGAEGGGVHFYGPSSIGKTTSGAAAASVWGRGDTKGFVRSWRATANGIEGAAALATHTAFVLDELSVGDPREVAAAVYTIANGTGKQRARRDGSAQEPRTWNVMVISTGETAIESKIEEDSWRKAKAKAGQTVRVLDIPADRELGHGVFDGVGAFANAGKLADAVKTAATTSYGTAGPAFVRGMIEQDPDKVSSWAQDVIEKFVQKHATAGASEQVGRVARKLGLIAAAGELASALGIVPWTRGDAWNASGLAFDAWIAARGGSGPHEEQQAIAQVRLIIEKYGNSRFERLPKGNVPQPPVSNRLGWKRDNGTGGEWCFSLEAWKTEVCAGLDHVAAARTLAKRGMLSLPAAKGHSTQQIKINGAPTRVYVITAAILA